MECFFALLEYSGDLNLWRFGHPEVQYKCLYIHLDCRYKQQPSFCKAPTLMIFYSTTKFVVKQTCLGVRFTSKNILEHSLKFSDIFIQWLIGLYHIFRKKGRWEKKDNKIDNNHDNNLIIFTQLFMCSGQVHDPTSQFFLPTSFCM